MCTDNIRTLVAVLVGTGLRLDEALHLRWDDIDLEHRLITVHRGRRGTTKSGRRRAVPIFDSVLPVLREMKLARGSNVMLWPGKNPGRPLGQASVRKPFKAAIERANLPREMRLHDLRHTFASLFLAEGGDIFKLCKILGHSSVAITERTYAHLMPTAFEGDYGRVRFEMPTSSPVTMLRAV
jgi:integrase